MFQHMDGSSTAWAPSVTALTHLAIVCEALLIESERDFKKLDFDNTTLKKHIVKLCFTYSGTTKKKAIFCEINQQIQRISPLLAKCF